MRKKNDKKSKKKTSTKSSPILRKIAQKFKPKITRKSLEKKKVKGFLETPFQNFSQEPINVSQISEGYQLPSQYGDNKLVLLVRDPWWFYAYWETNEWREKEVLDQIRRAGLSVASKMLRVYDVTDAELPDQHAFFDIEIGFANNWYVDVGKPDREWIAEIGFMAHGGRFFPLVRSNVVRTPRFGVSDVLDEEWLLPDELYWKIFGLSGGLGKQKSSLDVKEVLERYLRGLGASENSARIASHPKKAKSESQKSHSAGKIIERS